MTKKTISKEEFPEEDQEKLMKAIKRLRSLVENEPNLKVRKDDNFMLRYLRSFQYDPETAFHKMQNYYSLKYQHPEWYVTDESLASFKSELDNNLYYVLEDRDRFGKCIYINKLGLAISFPICDTQLMKNETDYSLNITITLLRFIDASKTTMQKQSQLQDIFLECVLDEDETQKNGLNIIVDLKHFSWALLRWLTPSNISIAVMKIESLPLKKLEFHVVNTSVLLNAAIKLIWPFLSAKTKENIHFHYEDWPSLHKIIDPKHLPEQYGGTKTNINIEKLLEIIPRSKDNLSGNLRLGYITSPSN